jgi:hypothetical protein
MVQVSRVSVPPGPTSQNASHPIEEDLMQPSSFPSGNLRARRRIVTTAFLLGLAIVGVGATVAAVANRTEDTHEACAIAHDAADVTPAPMAATAMSDDLPPLPTIKTPVEEPAEILEAYTFVATNPEIAKYMPCFCACGRDKVHKSVEDCYIKSRGASEREIVWSTHAGECMICLTVAHEARRLSLEGLSIADIRDEIERTLAPRFKWHTDTPMPPR